MGETRRRLSIGDSAANAVPLTLQDLRQELRTLREELCQLLGKADLQQDGTDDATLLDQKHPANIWELASGEVPPECSPRQGFADLRSELHSHICLPKKAFPPLSPRNCNRDVFLPHREDGFAMLRVGGDEENVNGHARSAPRSGQHIIVAESSWRAKHFERLMGLLVALNTALIGYQAHLEIGKPTDASPPAVHTAENFLCLAFSAEVVARLVMGPYDFFLGDRYVWNFFDTSLVLLQASETFFKHWHIAGVGTLRALRLVRLTRLVRLFATFDQLSAIGEALSSTFDSLVWMMVVITMIISAASICTLQGIVHFDMTDHPHVMLWFGGMGRTMLTMFECITSGVSWDDVARPLFEEVSPAIGLLLCLYIIVGLIFMMNIVTGFFVEQVIKSAVENRDKLMVQRISEHMLGDGDGIMTESEMLNVITKDIFVEKMQHPTMQEYLRAIDVPPASAPKLFDLFDVDGNGIVDREEIVNGCLSFRGNAKGLDVNVMLRAIGELRATLMSGSPLGRRGEYSPYVRGMVDVR